MIRAIAIAPSGDAAMLWLSREGQAIALAVSTYDDRGHLAWTRAVSAPGCRAASSGAVAFPAMGGLPSVVLAAGGRAFYVGWSTMDQPSKFSGHLARVVDGNIASQHDDVPPALIAANADVVVLVSLNPDPRVDILGAD